MAFSCERRERTRTPNPSFQLFVTRSRPRQCSGSGGEGRRLQATSECARAGSIARSKHIYFYQNAGARQGASGARQDPRMMPLLHWLCGQRNKRHFTLIHFPRPHRMHDMCICARVCVLAIVPWNVHPVPGGGGNSKRWIIGHSWSVWKAKLKAEAEEQTAIRDCKHAFSTDARGVRSVVR